MQASDIKGVFKKHDKNGDGRFNFKEFSTMMQRLSADFTPDKAQALFDVMDEDLSGTVDASEFVDFIMGDKILFKLFNVEDKPTEEEAKAALLTKPLEERHAAFQAAKDAGLKWGAMSWQERLDFCKNRSKGLAEDTSVRKSMSPSRDKSSKYQASPQWKSKPVAAQPPARPADRAPKPAAPVTIDSMSSGQVATLGSQKFGIAAKSQEELANYSLASDDLSWAGRSPEIMKEMYAFRDHLATVCGPLGTFKIEKFLAKGTAGWVFLVENKETGAKQAMKLIRMTVARTGIKEWYISKVLRNLGVDNVVLTDEDLFVYSRAKNNPIIDKALANAGPVPFYVCMLQPLMPWGSLEDMAKEGDLTPEIIFQAMEEVAKALKEMHENNIQHKDVKPENIMLVMEGDDVESAKLCDLGSASYGDHPKDKQDDIRRFGVTLFSVVTGEGWTKNRLIHASHDELIERLTEDVQDSDDPVMQGLPNDLQQILSGNLNMQEVYALIKERADEY